MGYGLCLMCYALCIMHKEYASSAFGCLTHFSLANIT